MGALSDTTSGRTSTSDPIVIPVGEGAIKDPDMAAEIKGRYETENITDSSAEEKLTINEGTQVADTQVVLTPENQEKLDQIKAEIEKDKQEAIRDAVIEAVGDFMLRALLSGGVSFGTMVNTITNTSLMDKIDKIEHSMHNREVNAERAGVECGYKTEFEGQTSEGLSGQISEIKDNISELNAFEKDFARFENLSLPETATETIKDLSSNYDTTDRDEIYSHKDDIISELRAEVDTLRTELRQFDKDHKNDTSLEIKAEKDAMSDKIRELNQSIHQVENFGKTYDSLTESIDKHMENIGGMKGCEEFSTPQEILSHKEDIVKEMKQDIKYVSSYLGVIESTIRLIDVTSSSSRKKQYCIEVDDNIINLEKYLANIRKACSGNKDLELLYDKALIDVPALSGTINSYRNSAVSYYTKASRVVDTYNALCGVYCQ
jgi:hypothetical protein